VDALKAVLDQAPRCLRCDYILVGLPGNRCPECGTTIDWDVVIAAARYPGLPIDRRGGWGRITGGILTWLLVLYRPVMFAKRLSERSSVFRATLFALVCMTLGIAGNAFLGVDRMGTGRELLAWTIGVWFHVECQSFVFLLLDLRKHSWLRQWSLWRKVSLYTTAFVALDWAAGPPMMDGYTDGGNFPWLLDPGSWWPLSKIDAPGLLRGVAYYWWMAVLLLTLWLRLHRKWCLLIIVVLMPGITMVSCRVGYHVADAAW
jgi:hypothetical protein